MLDDLLLLRVWAAPDAASGETRSKVAADLRPRRLGPCRGPGNLADGFHGGGRAPDESRLFCPPADGRGRGCA